MDRLFAWLAASLCLIVPAAAPAQTEVVGSTVAVNPAALSTPPGGTTQQVLHLGDEILFQQRISTGDTGQTLISFVDRSSLTVSTQSDVVIDEFVFDPRRGAGRLAASVAKGTFRFVGGAISKGEAGVVFKTPVATIGLRGGIVALDVRAARTLAIFLYGQRMTVTGTNGQSRSAYREGTCIEVDAAGRVSDPRYPCEEEIRAIAARLEPRTPNPREVDERRFAGFGSATSGSSTAGSVISPEFGTSEPLGRTLPEITPVLQETATVRRQIGGTPLSPIVSGAAPITPAAGPGLTTPLAAPPVATALPPVAAAPVATPTAPGVVSPGAPPLAPLVPAALTPPSPAAITPVAPTRSPVGALPPPPIAGPPSASARPAPVGPTPVAPAPVAGPPLSPSAVALHPSAPPRTVAPPPPVVVASPAPRQAAPLPMASPPVTTLPPPTVTSPVVTARPPVVAGPPLVTRPVVTPPVVMPPVMAPPPPATALLGNPGNSKPVGRAGEVPNGNAFKFNAPSVGGPGTRGASDRR